MKNFFGLLLVVGIIAAGVYGYFTFIKTPEVRGCEKLASLCGGASEKPEELKQCVDQMRKLKEVGGPEALNQPLKCISDAKTCGEGVGCAAGAYGRAGGKILQDALKGLEKALKE